jgi:hypothetical protein
MFGASRVTGVLYPVINSLKQFRFHVGRLNVVLDWDPSRRICWSFMCESLDSASTELAIDLAIERQRLQIESELARARLRTATTSIPPIRFQQLLDLSETFRLVDAGGGDLHTAPIRRSASRATPVNRPDGHQHGRGASSLSVAYGLITGNTV